MRAVCVERGMIWNKLRFWLFTFHQAWRHDYFSKFPFGKPGMPFYNTDDFFNLSKLRIQNLLKAGVVGCCICAQ